MTINICTLAGTQPNQQPAANSVSRILYQSHFSQIAWTCSSLAPMETLFLAPNGPFSLWEIFINLFWYLLCGFSQYICSPPILIVCLLSPRLYRVLKQFPNISVDFLFQILSSRLVFILSSVFHSQKKYTTLFLSFDSTQLSKPKIKVALILPYTF